MFVTLCGVIAFFLYVLLANANSLFAILNTMPYAFLFAIAISTIVFCIKRSMKVKQPFEVFALRAVAIGIVGYIVYGIFVIGSATHKLFLIRYMPSTVELDVMYEELKDKPCEKYNVNLLAEIAVKMNISTSTLEKIAKNKGVCLVQRHVVSGTGNSRGNAVKRLVAENERTNAATLEYLYSLKDYYITSSVARNKNTSVKILEQIYKEYGSKMDLDLAINHNTPGYILKELSVTDDHYVRAAIAKNPNTPPEIKKKIINEKLTNY